MAFSFLYGKYTRRDPCLNFPLSFFFLSLNGVKGLCFAFPQKKEGPSVGRSSSFFLVGKRRCKGLKVSPPPLLQTFALLFPLCSPFKERPLCLDLRRRREIFREIRAVIQAFISFSFLRRECVPGIDFYPSWIWGKECWQISPHKNSARILRA